MEKIENKDVIIKKKIEDFDDVYWIGLYNFSSIVFNYNVYLGINIFLENEDDELSIENRQNLLVLSEKLKKIVLEIKSQ